jgi:predicted GH43/DUF377 family glycosyl hydrolase
VGDSDAPTVAPNDAVPANEAGPSLVWGRHPANPLINRSGGNQTVVRVDGMFHLWVNGYSGASGFIIHGTSSDGINWDFAWDESHICEIEGMPDVGVWKLDPSVVYRAGGFTMWFTAYDPGRDGPKKIYVATSDDGLRWSDPRAISIDPIDPMEKWRTAPFVLHDGTHYHLYAHLPRGKGIVHATSEDGVVWERNANPVLVPGENSDTDGLGLYHPWVVRRDGQWIMFTAAHGENERIYITAATSDDGLSWSKLAQPLLAQIVTPGHWESDDLGRPSVLWVGNEAWLYYTGVEGGEPSVGLAIATGWHP